MLPPLVGKYKVLGSLGTGTLGVVALAEDPATGRQVAIKLLSPLLQQHAAIVSSFLDAAGNGQELGQSGVLPFLAQSEPTDPTAYVVTEYVADSTLECWLKKPLLSLRAPDPLLVCQQLASTLASAHARGMVHGDLHPGNVLLIPSDSGSQTAKLMDFAVAKVTAVARRVGLPLTELRPEVLSYRAPEQSHAAGEPDTKSDVYALGRILLKMIEASSAGQEMAPRSHMASPVMSAPGSGVQQLLVRMLAVDPQQRPTMADVAAQLSATSQPPSFNAAVTAAPYCGPDHDTSTLAATIVAPPAEPGNPPLAATVVESSPAPIASALAATLVESPPAPDAPSLAATVVESPPTSSVPPAAAAVETAPAQRSPPADFPVQIGQCIGSYRMVAVLGEGGMGVVFDAQHNRLSRRVAIKVLRPQFSRNPDMVARFFTEAESVNVINHPDIVSVYEFGQLPDQTVYIVMEFLKGQTLAKRLEKTGGILGLDSLRLMRQVASAVAAAHAHNIIHRDLKPDNVMIIADPDVPGGERAKVVDFGIAKMKPAGGVIASVGQTPRTLPDTDPEQPHATRSGAIMGTPLYMSPEQFRDAATVTDKADVYSLGVMLYEALAGRPPFTANSLSELSLAHQSAPPPPLRGVDSSIPAELLTLIDRMLAKQPAARPPMAEVAAVLDRLVLGPARMSAKKSVLLALLSVAVVASISFVLYQFVWQRRVDLPSLRARALLVLREGLADPDPSIRRRTAQLVGQSRDVNHASLLGPLLADRDPLVQLQAASGLRRLGARGLVPTLIQAAQRGGTAPETRVQIAGALAELGETKGETVLREALRSSDAEVRRRAVLLLAERGDRQSRDLLLREDNLREERVSVLGLLARFGDMEARAALQRGLQGIEGTIGEGQLLCAEELARNADDDGQARTLLEQLAQKEGPNRLRAARILATLDDPSFYDVFRARFVSDRSPLNERILAAEGLGACGRKESASLLATTFPRESGRALRLRLSAAGALLQIAASDPGLLAGDSLNLIQLGLADARWEERVLATLALGDAAPSLGLPLLGKAIGDPESEVRRSAAYSLGRTHVREALPVLGLAIDDNTVAVRKEVIHAMGWVGKDLRGRGQSVKEVVRAVAARVERGEPSERLVTVAALASLGNPGHQVELQQWLHSPDPQIRMQAVAAWSADAGADPQPLRMALADSDFAVRFEAAAQLAERGAADGVAVLQLAREGSEAVRARGLLQKLGVATPGSLTLGAASPEVRVAMIGAANYLTDDEALALLRQGSRDSVVAVRLRVLESLADLAAVAVSEAGRKLLRLLLGDPNPMVRTRAGLLAGQLGISLRLELPAKSKANPRALTDRRAATSQPVRSGAAEVATPDLGLLPDRAATPDLALANVRSELPLPPLRPTAPGQRGHLRIEAEPQVRFQIDRHQMQTGAQPRIPVAAGRHRITHAQGTIEVEVPPDATVTVRIPVSLGEQVLQDGVAAFERGELAEARRTLEKARGLLESSHPSHGQWYHLHYYLGRINEAQGRFILAMTEYEKLKRKVPEAHQSAAQRQGLAQAVARVGLHLGRIRIGKMIDGKCQTTEVWLEPGEHNLEDRGTRKTIKVRAGEISTIESCQ